METLVHVAVALLAFALGDRGPKSAALVRAEHFLLELADDRALGLAGPAANARPLGLAVCRRRAEGTVEQLEWEIRFREAGVPDTRVLHVERRDGERSKLVWRSWSQGSGRTLIVEGVGEGALRVLEWGRSQTLREQLEPVEGAVMPLALQELAREGRLAAGPGGGVRWRLFDPMSRRHERVRVECLVAAFAPREGGAEATTERRVEVRRDDDSLAAAWLFDAEGLKAFQWQAGGVRGRRISAREYRQHLGRIPTGGE